jgi:GNAT superfamily N-acetyltransferase
VSTDRYRVELLGGSYDRAAFTCGVGALDRYLQQQAGQDTRRKVAVVFVLIDTHRESIVGYYTLSACSIEPSDLPRTVTRKLPHYRDFPAVLLGRLAILTRYQSQGFGRRLLVDALKRSLDQSNHIGAMAVIVDAKDESAVRFYERYGFQPFVTDRYRLFLPMQDILRLADSE